MSETTLQPSSETSGDHPVPATNAEPRMIQPVSAPNATEQLSNYPPLPPRTVGSETLKYAASILILAVGFGVALAMFFQKPDSKEQDSLELIPMVGVVKVLAFNGELDKVISGTVVPYREINVSAEVSGRILKKHEIFESGNFVKKGTPLIEIDPEDYKLQLKTGVAELNQSKQFLLETEEEIEGAKRNVEHAENEYKLAEADDDRNQRIKKALSSSEIDQSKRSLLTAQTALTTRNNTLLMLKARLNRLQASFELSEAQLERTQLNINKTIIVAPDDGVIVREMVQEGDYVSPGTALVTFEDTSRSEVICNLTPTDLAWVRKNSPASSEITDSPNQFSVYHIPKTKVSIYELGDSSVVWEGMLERFDGIGRDESTRTIPCRITIKNPVVQTDAGPRALVRGMFVKCEIVVQTSAESDKRRFLSFPAEALRPGNEIWTVVDRKLKRHQVEVVDYSERMVGKKLSKIVVVAAKDGSVSQGDMVVTTPLAQPSEDTAVILDTDLKKDVKSDEESEADKAAD
ncbi:MAG: multidrug efflux pump subunit AcrA (membrane-fusion protein) [Mariniblastus sp.]|jgi:multidrug efflux pump subunit AcrA (membrane-fusion protein)